MENFNLIPIENEGKRVLTTAQLAEAYETNAKTTFLLTCGIII